MITWSYDLAALKDIVDGTELLLQLSGWDYYGHPAPSGVVHVMKSGPLDEDYAWSIMNDADGANLCDRTGWRIKAWSLVNADPAEFTPTESYQLLSKPAKTVHVGPCPWNNCVRSMVKGREVTMNGRVYVVEGIEAYAKVAEPQLGETIGLALRDKSLT